MVDLGDGEAKVGEVLLLGQHLLQPLLHQRQLALGDADLVGAGGRADDPPRIVRRLGKSQHRTRHRPDRADHDQVNRGIDQHGGEQRDQQRDEGDVARIDEHGLAQGVVGHDQLEFLVAVANRSKHAQHALAAEKQRVQGAGHALDHADTGDIDMFIDLRRHLGHDQKPRDAAVAHGNRLGADRHQHVILGGAGERIGFALHQDDRHGRRRAQPLLQPAQPVAGNPGQENEDFGQEHEDDGEQQELRRQPARQRHRTDGGVRRSGAFIHG